MTSPAWTLDRVAAAKPELAPLARLHAALDEAARSVEDAATPRFDGTPALHWLQGRPLLDVVDCALLAPAVAARFDALARAIAAAFDDARAAVDEMRAAAARLDWSARLAAFRDVPDERDVPHPELFRFLLLRAVSVPAARLAREVSAPHADRWLRAACPWCGIPPAAAVAGQGGGRTLLCVLCAGRWPRGGHDCVACGEDKSGTRLVLADRELGPASIEACATCRHAVKVFAPADLPDGPPIALEVLTVHLDVLARSAGYSRDETALAAVFPPP